MGIYTAPNVLAYKVNGSSLDTNLNMNSGTYNVTVKQWDNCGWATGTKVAFTVNGSSSKKAYVFSDLQSKTGWDSYALLPPMSDLQQMHFRRTPAQVVLEPEQNFPFNGWHYHKECLWRWDGAVVGCIL